MAPKSNPLKLNALQLKTLTVLQQLATVPLYAVPDEESGGVLIRSLPRPHGNHFHCGDAVVMSKDATGLQNPNVWSALERKGLARSMYPAAIALLPDGLAYDTGLSDEILHRSDH
jgi:hypothetical protein